MRKTTDPAETLRGEEPDGDSGNTPQERIDTTRWIREQCPHLYGDLHSELVDLVTRLREHIQHQHRHGKDRPDAR